MSIFRIIPNEPKPIRDEYTRDQLPEAIATLRRLRREHGRDSYVLVEIGVSDKAAPVDGAALLDVRDVTAIGADMEAAPAEGEATA